ncbi:MAG: methyltransferase domain-containing protein [Labilithrix sp.]|nr:methyltransferase domain-containing protein [Labilithrix sp.]
MDLIETNDGPRHPWEKSRAAFFTGVVERTLGGRGGLDVLDCGAGDAFFSATMSARVGPRSVTCWDASYDEATVARLGELYGGSGTTFSFTRTMPERRFDLVLMLDVIEHVEDDVGFVSEIVEACLAPERGLALVSVPAWQALFSRHDELLLHHRRYSPDECDRVLRAAGLELVERGGLFHSLVAPRLASVVRERASTLAGRTTPLAASAASTWRGGRLVTSVVDAALRVDNAVSRAAARAGLNLPGLSYWALARRRS